MDSGRRSTTLIGYMLITKRWDWWRIVVIVVLGLTALTKFLSLFKPAHLLFQPDPILGAKLWLVVLGAAVLETGICVFLAIVREERKQASVVFGFAVLILAYRAALYVNGTHFCPCLGNAVGWWPWLGAHETQVLITVALWLLFTSLMKLVRPDCELLALEFKANSRFL